MPSLSSARLFYEKALAGGAQFLESLVTEKTSETEWLDFKGGDQLAPDTVKTTWSRAMCGFANNQGGVLVWGIDARFDERSQVDAASSIKAVPDPAALRSRLAQLHTSATEPPLAGVESKEFFCNGSNGPGFVVSYIPESDIKPHRAEQMEGKPYIMRFGDSFKIVSVSVLRNLFYPRSNARFELEATTNWQPWQYDANAPNRRVPGEIEVRHSVFLRNVGTVSAKDVFVLLHTNLLDLEFETSKTRRKVSSGEGIEIGYPLHPTGHEMLCNMKHKLKVVSRFTANKQEYVPTFSNVNISAQVFSTDMPPSRIEIAIDGWDLEMSRTKQGSVIV